MTHEGRMARGMINEKLGLLDNEDTKYYLEHREGTEQKEEEAEVEEEKKTKKKRK